MILSGTPTPGLHGNRAGLRTPQRGSAVHPLRAGYSPGSPGIQDPGWRC